jgi:hypothetical protein
MAVPALPLARPPLMSVCPGYDIRSDTLTVTMALRAGARIGAPLNTSRYRSVLDWRTTNTTSPILFVAELPITTNFLFGAAASRLTNSPGIPFMVPLSIPPTRTFCPRLMVLFDTRIDSVVLGLPGWGAAATVLVTASALAAAIAVAAAALVSKDMRMLVLLRSGLTSMRR